MISRRNALKWAGAGGMSLALAGAESAQAQTRPD